MRDVAQPMIEPSPGGAIEIWRWIRNQFGGIVRLITRTDKAFVAAVNGPAAGVDLAFALACDVLVLSEEARIVPAFGRVGLVPEVGTSWQLTRRRTNRRCASSWAVSSATLAPDPMAARRVVTGLAVVAAIAVAVAGCGSGSGSGGGRTPRLSSLPLASGVRVMRSVRQCNGGSNAYCAVELVVLGPRYRSSRDLVLAERDRLRAAGWVGASPTTGDQLANESPNNKLRVTYATAFEDLKGADLGWITRSWPTISALDETLFDRLVAMSVLLEIGSR